MKCRFKVFLKKLFRVPSTVIWRVKWKEGGRWYTIEYDNFKEAWLDLWYEGAKGHKVRSIGC